MYRKLCLPRERRWVGRAGSDQSNHGWPSVLPRAGRTRRHYTTETRISKEDSKNRRRFVHLPASLGHSVGQEHNLGEDDVASCKSLWRGCRPSLPPTNQSSPTPNQSTKNQQRSPSVNSHPSIAQSVSCWSSGPIRHLTPPYPSVSTQPRRLSWSALSPTACLGVPEGYAAHD